MTVVSKIIVGLRKNTMIKYWFIILSLAFSSSCSVKYSFTGAAIPPDVKSVSVHFFRNIAPLVNPKLSDQFTEALKNKLMSETRLRLTSGNADLTFEGEIVGYDVTYQGVQANETAGLNKLTITMKLRYTNSKEPNKSFEKTFSSSATYPSSSSLDGVEDGLVTQIDNEILNQMFNATVADW